MRWRAAGRWARGHGAGRGRRAGGSTGRAAGWAQARGTRQAGAGWHGRAACAHRLGQLGARAPGLVFNLVFRLGIFPKSPNEHCSL